MSLLRSPLPSPGRRRLLFLLPFPPRLDAAHGGGRVIAQLLLELLAHHEIGLLYLRAPDEAQPDEALLAHCCVAESVPRAPVVTSWPRRLRLSFDLLRGVPMWASDWHVPAYAARLQKLLDQWRPDIVHAEFHVMSQYLAPVAAAGIPTVITEHEPGITAAAGLVQTQKGSARLLYYADLLAWRRFESKMLPRAQNIVVFTEHDRQCLLPHAGNTPITCIPLGGLLPAQALDAAGAAPPTILFVGNFAHFPNVDAAFRLVKYIFPRIQEAHPAASLLIVGPHPPPALDAFRSEAISVTGWLDSVTPYLEKAAVVVAPLRYGGGMRVKMIEALAAGKAIVASPLACAGLTVEDGKELLIAEEDETFAAAVVSLLEQPARRQRLGSAARHWAGQNLDWKQAVAAYQEIYERLLAGAPAGHPVAPVSTQRYEHQI